MTTSIEAPAPSVEQLVAEIQQRFRTFGGASSRDDGNPIAAAMAEQPVQFALGVNVRAVVTYIVTRLVSGDTERLEWWFARGLTDSVCVGSVDLWWADEQDGDVVERVTHGTSVRDAIDKAMRGIFEAES